MDAEMEDAERAGPASPDTRRCPEWVSTSYQAGTERSTVWRIEYQVRRYPNQPGLLASGTATYDHLVLGLLRLSMNIERLECPINLSPDDQERDDWQLLARITEVPSPINSSKGRSLVEWQHLLTRLFEAAARSFGDSSPKTPTEMGHNGLFPPSESSGPEEGTL
jgi:hypothetical protein